MVSEVSKTQVSISRKRIYFAVQALLDKIGLKLRSTLHAKQNPVKNLLCTISLFFRLTSIKIFKSALISPES